MEDEFNDFSEDVGRQKEEIKGWARVNMELSKLGTDKDFTQAVKEETIKLEQEDRNKYESIKNLENEFIVSSDIMQDIANKVRNGYLRKDSYQNLKSMLDYLVSGGEDLYSLTQEYAELTGDETLTHPNYDKYIEYSKDKETEDVKSVLSHTFLTCLKLLHPFMPFFTEEIWSKLPIKNKNLLLVEKWPSSN